MSERKALVQMCVLIQKGGFCGCHDETPSSGCVQTNGCRICGELLSRIDPASKIQCDVGRKNLKTLEIGSCGS